MIEGCAPSHSMLDGGPSVRAALLAGASDYISKSASPDELVAALHRVAAGRTQAVSAEAAPNPHGGGRSAAEQPGVGEVLRLYAQGIRAEDRRPAGWD